MLKRFISLFGFIRTESRRRKALGDASMSLNLSIQLKDITVRVVHAGGREELYHNAIPAAQLLKKYPGMCVARPEVFKNPNESILSAEEKLLPGYKYYIIPSTTVQKVKRKHSKKKGEEPAGCKGKKVAAVDASGDFSDGSMCSAKDYYISKGRGSSCSSKKNHKGKQQFTPPNQKPRPCKELDWEPSLTSIQELSP